MLRRFTVDDTIAFFTAVGVELKTEDTGKLVPTSDSARTGLRAPGLVDPPKGLVSGKAGAGEE